jgi:hypothetical protein
VPAGGVTIAGGAGAPASMDEPEYVAPAGRGGMDGTSGARGLVVFVWP